MKGAKKNCARPIHIQELLYLRMVCRENIAESAYALQYFFKFETIATREFEKEKATHEW